MFDMGIRKKTSFPVLVTGMIVLLFVAVAISFSIGRFPLRLDEIGGILYSKTIENIGAMIQQSGIQSFFESIQITPFWASQTETVLFQIRLPRILLALLVGSALSGAGAAYQGVFQNPMASPDILGASSGAALGASFAILIGVSWEWITIFAFVMSLFTIFLVLMVSKRGRGKQVTTIILSGIMIGALCSAFISLIKLVADPADELPAITFWQMGGLSGVGMDEIKFIIIPLVIGMVPLIMLSWRINILTLGEDEARSMGINTGALRIIIIMAATLVTASSVAVSGVIGWIGLVVPNMCRRVVGNDYRKLMPVSMLGGALFLLLVDNISRTLLVTEIPLGILTAFVGAPFFLHLITKKGDYL